MKPYIEGDWYGEFANEVVFSSVYLSRLSIGWSGGQGIAADDLYELSIPFCEYKLLIIRELKYLFQSDFTLIKKCSYLEPNSFFYYV